MRIVEVRNVQPRNCAIHGLFGSKYLKCHNMRDNRWTINDLIEQFERLGSIYAKDEKSKRRQRTLEESIEAETYRKLKKEFKNNVEMLEIVLRGDAQRTKNLLINFPNYMRVYQNKQSYEVLEELDAHTFQMRKKLDRKTCERQRLMDAYETHLMNVAKKQETIRYHDIKEFKQERDTKRLYVELKNSETRWRAIENMNLTYKYVIDQLLHDSLYYQPVLEALNDDYKEQSRLVQETFNIGFPTIRHFKKIEKQVQKLAEETKRDEKEQYDDLMQNRLALKQHSKKVKELVRRDSDFFNFDDRYTRETGSMTNLRLTSENVQKTVNEFMLITLANTPEEIISRITSKQASVAKFRDNIARMREIRKATKVQMSSYKAVQMIILDRHSDLLKDELVNKMTQLQRAKINNVEKEMSYREQIEKLTHTANLLNHAIVHILDIVRNVEPENIFTDRQFPSELLNLPLLRFNKDLPKEPKQIMIDESKVIPIIKAKIRSIVQFCKKMGEKY